MAMYEPAYLPPNAEEQDFVQAYENVREKYKDVPLCSFLDSGCAQAEGLLALLRHADDTANQTAKELHHQQTERQTSVHCSVMPRAGALNISLYSLLELDLCPEPEPLLPFSHKPGAVWY
ncbi:uncharacterized protein V6R79_019978 [Siganus canaliculatus]